MARGSGTDGREYMNRKELKERLILLTVHEVGRAGLNKLNKQTRRLGIGSTLVREGNRTDHNLLGR